MPRGRRPHPCSLRLPRRAAQHSSIPPAHDHLRSWSPRRLSQLAGFPLVAHTPTTSRTMGRGGVAGRKGGRREVPPPRKGGGGEQYQTQAERWGGGGWGARRRRNSRAHQPPAVVLSVASPLRHGREGLRDGVLRCRVRGLQCHTSGLYTPLNRGPWRGLTVPIIRGTERPSAHAFREKYTRELQGWPCRHQRQCCIRKTSSSCSF